MKRKTRNATETKNLIISRSASVFNIHGYAGTSMQMLVNATGFQKGGIYCHFDSKISLAKEAFKFNCELLRHAYFDGVAELDCPKDKLIRFLNNYKKFIAKPNIKGGCPLLNTTSEVDDTNDEFRILAHQYFTEITDILEDILKMGLKKGDINAQIDPKTEVQFLLATLEGAIMIGQLNHSKKVVGDIYTRLFSYIEERYFN